MSFTRFAGFVLPVFLLVGCEPTGGAVSYIPPVRPAPTVAKRTPPAEAPRDEAVVHGTLVPKSQLDKAPARIVVPAEDFDLTAATVEPLLSTGYPARLVRGDTEKKRIALTFDDGPHRGYTERLIKTLVGLKVSATFFFIGQNVDSYPDLAKLAADNGIELGNHTYSHSRLRGQTRPEVEYQVAKGFEAIERATGVRPSLFRPPGGDYDDQVCDVARQAGLSMILWTSDAADYTTVKGNPTAADVYRHVMKSATNGGIVIMHDPMPGTLEALPKIVADLRAKGFEFVKISDFLKDPKSQTWGGRKVAPRPDLTQELISGKRYPLPRNPEDKYESPEQGAPSETASKGAEDQRTRVSGQSRSQGREGQVVDTKAR
ncbi:MAG: polysaccharide deacetylase family protein [Armatimonadetes bacterium]|nr:polysaccharide deacetylase family protein [Armatimonadota bacterium]